MAVSTGSLNSLGGGSLRRQLVALGVVPTLFVLASCARTGDGVVEPDETTDEQITVNVAHFPNLTHAPAIVGLEDGIFEEALGEDVELNVETFDAGTDVVDALFAEDIDISYIGPNQAVNAFIRSKGEAVRIIAGAMSGGAALVTRPEITSPEGLRGKTISSPSLGNTQDVALRAWLDDKELGATKDGAGDVSISPQENVQILEAFRSGDIDGAWVPEPWASRLVIEGGGHVLLDEENLWEDGEYATTVIIARTAFLEDHPDVVERFLIGHVEAIEQIEADPDAAKAAVRERLESITGTALEEEVLDPAWDRLSVTYDPLIDTIRASATDARAVDLLDDDDIEGIEDLQILNDVLDAAGKESVET